MHIFIEIDWEGWKKHIAAFEFHLVLEANILWNAEETLHVVLRVLLYFQLSPHIAWLEKG